MKPILSTAMMDEVDFQLCLDIDSPVSYHHFTSSSNGPQTQFQELDTPRSKYQTRKRFSGSVGHDGVPSEGMSGSQTHRHNDDDIEDKRYLELPPRKRVRTSLSLSALESKDRVVDDNADEVARITDTLDLRGGSLSQTESVVQQVCRDPDLPSPEDTSVAINSETKIGGNQVASVRDRDEASIPQPLIPDIIHRRLQPPFAYYPEGGYMPATLESLTSRSTPAPRACRFVIYEDPESMELDGDEGFYFVPPWFLSPEDDKENADDEHGQGNHVHENVSVENSQEDYHLTYRDVEQYSATNITASFQGLDVAEPEVPARENPAGNFPHRSSWREHERWTASTSTSMSTRTHQHQYQHQARHSPLPNNTFTFTSTPATPRADYFEHPVPSPTSLSATEVSLLALPGQVSRGSNPGTPTPENSLRSRRPRRTIRSVNLV
ncbi:hypothetical protein BJX61DRAFT_492972 [Aspergillus egyptiacus]|nr:hypothetical protein BJX61DRAFT_492972 [Aspergillus egyptiacus]